MRRLVGLALLLSAMSGRAETAYVSDELVLGVYSEQNQQGQRLTTLHSGASVETLGTSGDFTQVQLGDGTKGWVKSSYLTTREPATARVKKLEEELDRSRATTPALAEAAARSEVERLQQELKTKQSELDSVRAAGSEPTSASGASQAAEVKPVNTLTAASALLLVAACGFWLGYVTLARRIKRKFGGLKVY